MAIFKRKGSPYYFCEFQMSGRKFRGSTKETSRRKAIEAERRFKVKLSDEIALESKMGAAQMTLDVAFGRYMNEIGDMTDNPHLLRRDLQWALNFFGGSKKLCDLSMGDISEAIAKRRGEGVSNATVNRSLTEPLRRVLHAARKRWNQSIQNIIFKELILKEANGRIRELSVDEETRLFQYLHPDAQPLVQFAIKSGLRRSNLINLKWEEVDLYNRELTVVVKGNRNKRFPLSRDEVAILNRMKGAHPVFVFTIESQTPRMKGERIPFTGEGIHRHFARAKELAGIENFRFHDLRHTAATRARREGADLITLKTLLGHSRVETTERYAHVNSEDVRNAKERIKLHTKSHTLKIVSQKE